MSSTNRQSPPATDSTTTDAPVLPSNRAARRAARKGKAADGKPAGPRKDDQSRHSQVIAQPRFKGRRGNR